MSVEEILEKATIDFPMPLDLDQTEELLDYISEKLPANINSRTQVFYQRYQDKSKKQKKERGTVRIAGNISNLEQPMMFSSFETIHSTDTSKISAIRFSTIPGYLLEEHRPEEVQLWGIVRQHVADYFKK